MTTSPASSANDDTRARVLSNLARAHERIASSGRDIGSVRIVAVTKTFGDDELLAAASLGLTHVGENYIDELCTKRERHASLSLTWHYLGALQTNKIARVLQCASLVSGVSRRKEIAKIASLSPGFSIDVQVDFTNRAERNGAPPSEVPMLVREAREDGLNVRGLMVVAPPDPEGARAAFTNTARLADELDIRERSMGMSDDLEMACVLGSTEVRLGRALFGPRVP